MSNKIRVMIAEDIEVLRDYLAEMLEKEDDISVVGCASSGAEITDMAATQKADVIVMDIDMETSTAGIIAANSIVRNSPDTKIIFLTVNENDETIIDAMATGAVDYVVKSADCKEAIRHIRAAYEDKVVLDAAISKILNNEFFRMKRAKADDMDAIRAVMLLTPSERQIVSYLLKGKKVTEIAKERVVELATIKKQIGMILKKFDKSRTKEVVADIKRLNIEEVFKLEEIK